MIEIADHADTFGVRRPHREVSTTRAYARAHALIQTRVRTLVEEVHIFGGDDRLLAHLRSLSTICSNARTCLYARISGKVYFRRRCQLGCSSEVVPGTFCGLVSSHKSSRLTSTICASL